MIKALAFVAAGFSLASCDRKCQPRPQSRADLDIQYGVLIGLASPWAGVAPGRLGDRKMPG